MVLKLRSNRSFWIGVLCGAAAVLAVRYAVNETTIADRLLAPMLVNDSTRRADAIVVLGAGLIGDCVANMNATRRVLRGARLFKEERAPLLVITGGRGADKCPVADVMAELARELGVPADRIVIERQSRNTHENGERTAPLLRERQVRSVLLVTDQLHMRRAAGVFTRLGFVVEPSAVPIYEGHIDNVDMLTAGIREAAALAYYRIRGWVADPGASALHATRDSTGVDVERPRRIVQDHSGDTVDRASIQDAGNEAVRPLVILGASYAGGWDLKSVAGAPVVNAGIGGQQSFEMLERFDRDVVSRQPLAVVLWGFINDIHRAPGDEQTVARIKESYLEMIRRARSAGIEPILATEVTVRPAKTFMDTSKAWLGWLFGKRSYQDGINEQVVSVNAWVRETAEHEGLLLLDLHAALSDSSGLRRWAYAVEDGSHISAEGYAALTHYAEPILTRHLEALMNRELERR